MSDALRGLAASEERNKVGPDYFGYFLHEVEQLISQDEDTLLSSSPSSCLSEKKCAGIRDKNTVNVSGSSFSHCILPRLSDSKNERLKLLLNEALKLLTSEVDQVLEPVISMCQLQSQIRTKKCMSSNAGPVSDGGEDRVPRKRPKLSSSSETAIFTHDSPNNCESFGEGDDDLQFLLKNDSLLVEETIKKHSDELSATLGHMEQQLEKLLQTVVSKCRPMSLNEKQQLCKLIQKLPPQNLNRVAEIIQQSRPSEKQYCDEISVNLENEDIITLWRLYYYVEAVEKAKRLSASSISTLQGHS
ncbi:hypothetical protein HS088_TW12G00793 [Tripterygium wilfordii]|uniref:NET domain-containing protein n=1 Tax=Tripterygium wilfordii TaxID=458696 RepID=A0A7J7CZS3_TRIWF|nr:uncharacterized protein LOC120011597 isoform X1 [Tripterygium wilfordii]KAF5739584.1 hypothetical protein HS088_TW12G00793 [Tripterygium wilfordii]